MARIQISSPLDMHSVDTWDGYIASHDANNIVIVNGSLQGIYTGNFTYDGTGQVYGTLTGFSETYSGLSIVTASGLNVSANIAESLIQSDQIQAFLQTALAGDDQFALTPGSHVVDGYGGNNTVTEAQSFSTYRISGGAAALSLNSSITHDTLYNIQGVYFSDGFYDIGTQTFSASGSGFAATDMSTVSPVSDSPQAYSGPVLGLQSEYISITADKLNISVRTPNWFIHSGSGDDAIAVDSGTNVLDGGTGSNFLTGGGGTDTYFVDDRGPAADIWSTVVGFHAGDAATIWGVTPQDFNFSWIDGQGAAGFTGLTLHATAAGRPIASLTLAGFSQADMGSGRLSVSFGSDPVSGSAYMYIHGNN
jgi:Ca2+-binding RTX toxin-like protein